MKAVRAAVLAALLSLGAARAHAHEVRPGYLELREIAPGVFEVLFKTPTLAGTRFNLRMTRLDLGSFLGLTQETVSRALSGFSADAVIRVHNRELQILDAERLHQIVAHSRRAI